MMRSHGQRFLKSTRGRIIGLLRRKTRTVNELAATLGVTDNAVRAQLAILERDGLVVESGTTPGVRKPHAAFDLTPQAESLFPKAYEALLRELLTELARDTSPLHMQRLLRAVGGRIASAFRPAAVDATLRQRVDAAARALEELGGLTEIEEREGRLFIRGFSCPLQSAVMAYPGACQVAEALLTDIIGVPVRERCEKGASPRCCFEIHCAS
jgi:predicted ArsR family transcriptional regulator